MSASCVENYPSDLLSVICSVVYSAGLPPPDQSLDPLVLYDCKAPTALPSFYPPPNWPEPLARKTLYNLCFVNRAWYNAAKPWLWRRIEVKLPRSWLSLVDEITGGEEEMDEQEVDISIQEAALSALVAQSSSSSLPTEEAAQKLHESILATLSGPDSSIPFDLLTPPVSREPSPRRLRTKSKSPSRWGIMRSINDAVRNVMEKDEPGAYVPMPHDPSPGRHVRYLDFNHFRTIGMRRSIEESINSRFVTGDRLLSVLKETPNLLAFGATEYMDGALTLPVLKELLLRGSPSRGRGRPSRGRSQVVADEVHLEEEDRERRREYRELEAIDLTGCISGVFFSALTEFVNTYVRHDGAERIDDNIRGRGERSPQRNSPLSGLSFPGVQRLSLRGTKIIPPETINLLVLAFPALTHLDLSATRVTPQLLSTLGESSSVRLQSLALARCVLLSGSSIVDFLVNSRVVRDLTELSLYGDAIFPSPLSEDDLLNLITLAPPLTSGNLRYLDLSSAPLTSALLKMFSPQPNLRSLGLSHIPRLSLRSIAEFLRTRAPNMEILSMVSTSPELTAAAQARQISMALHSILIQPLCTAPFKCSIQISLNPTAISDVPDSPAAEAPTRLRVIELAVSTLSVLGAGADSWRIIRSKGGRAWYVDIASGWVAQTGSKSVLKRGLPPDHPLRVELKKLADANGNVNSGIGWHARKMEVLHGNGLLGREDGLYGAVSFAYQG